MPTRNARLILLVWSGFMALEAIGIKEDSTDLVKALSVPKVPSVWHGALECSPEDCNNCPDIDNGLNDSGKPFIFQGWCETPNEHGEG